MLGWLRRTPFPDAGRDRRPRGRRHADAVLRPGGPPCPRLSRCPGCGSSRIRPRSIAARWRRRRTSTVLRFAPDDAFAHRRRRRRRRRRRTPSSSRSAGFVGAWLAARRRRAPRRVAAAGRAPGARPGLGRRRARPRSGCRRRRRRAARRPPRPTPTSSTAPARDERATSRRCPPIRWHEPKPSYDVVIIGGGGHGLSTAYYLATRHGITNVAVLEADYIASGNTGRNTTIIRANYGIPEAIRFYQHSLELYQGLEAETGAAILHQTKGIFWVAHTEMAMRTERARCLMNTACGAKTFMVTPGRAQGARPAGRPDRRRPLPGPRRLAPRRGRDGPPRPGRLGVRGRRDRSAASTSSSTRR